MALTQFKCNVYRINSTTVPAYLMSFPAANILVKPVPADQIAFSNSLNVYGIIQYDNANYWVKETQSEIVTAINT